MAVLRMQNVYFVASDVGRAAGFWRDALGMPIRFSDADRWVQLQAGGQSFALASAAEGVPGQCGAVPVFEVDAMEPQVAAIVALGGRILATRDMGSHGRVVTFSDPEGNVAQLFARAAGPR